VRRGVQGLERQLQPARERRPHSGDRGRAPTRGDFIAILSPGYLASAWCRDEARLFTQHFAGDLTGRVFVLEKARLDDAVTVPQGLKGLRGYRFWFVDVDKQPRTFAMPMPQQGEIQYFRQVDDLARDIHRRLRAMAGAPLLQQPAGRPLTGRGADGSNGASVAFLAEVTEDLELRRDEVRRYLEQQGVVVLPEGSLPLARPIRAGAGCRFRTQPRVCAVAWADAGKKAVRRARGI